MTESNKRQLISLKGITSTNDDPDRCAICLNPFSEGLYYYNSVTTVCCGQRACLSCHEGRLVYDGRQDCCKLCGSGGVESIGNLKKKAKKGYAWAQMLLGRSYFFGKDVQKSEFEAVRWFRKAVAQNHPVAMIMLGDMLSRGIGCDQNLGLARIHLDKAMSIDEGLVGVAQEALIAVAAGYANSGDRQTAISIATPIAESGKSFAQYNLGVTLSFSGDIEAAYKWLSKAALGASGIAEKAAFEALRCCVMSLQMWPQTKFWLSVTTKNLRYLLSDAVAGSLRIVGRVNSCRNAMRDLRNKCGGCGAELSGTMRKKCGACKTFCYCSRDCQKAHWNRKKNGHRKDCKEVMELKKKMKEARKAKNTTVEE